MAGPPHDPYRFDTADIPSSALSVNAHPFTPDAKLRSISLGDQCGLVALTVHYTRLPPHNSSTPAVWHSHKEEWFYIISGRGTLRLRAEDGSTTEEDIVPGDFICFPAGERVAHAINAGEEELVYLTGGTKEPLSISHYPESGRRTIDDSTPSGRTWTVLDSAVLMEGPFALPGTESVPGPPAKPLPHRISTADLPLDAFDLRKHPVNPTGAQFYRISPGDRCGLTRVGLHLIRIAPHTLSTELHWHTSDEEWMFVLSTGAGGATLRIRNGGKEGAETLEEPVQAGTFVGLPAGKRIAHAFRAGDEELVYVVGGTRASLDVCTYPEAGAKAIVDRLNGRKWGVLEGSVTK